MHFSPNRSTTRSSNESFGCYGFRLSLCPSPPILNSIQFPEMVPLLFPLLNFFLPPVLSGVLQAAQLYSSYIILFYRRVTGWLIGGKKDWRLMLEGEFAVSGNLDSISSLLSCVAGASATEAAVPVLKCV